MNYTFIFIGILAVLYGIYTIIVRIKNPQKLTKLTEMKKRMDNKRATIIHTIFYSVFPIIVGIVFIISELIKEISL